MLKFFTALSSSCLKILHNYLFYGQTKLFSNLYLVTFLRISVKLFFLYTVERTNANYEKYLRISTQTQLFADYVQKLRFVSLSNVFLHKQNVLTVERVLADCRLLRG